ncbi:MAG TPA: hypothetical protein VGO48_17855 [Conexibacter sp.]|jgi:hypothetical protein|nr:hypothetical protein [Conexibacter sp.]
MDGSIDERIDLGRLKAERFTWRLFLAHPAFGLEETDGHTVIAPGAGTLGVAWLALDVAEQRARERDLLRELLSRAARHPVARFEAGWWRREGATADLARRCGASVSDLDGVACGALTDDAVSILVETLPQVIVVEALEEMALQVDGDPLCIGVWTDRWKAPALERELLDHVWDEARRRERPGTSVDVSRRREVNRVLRASLVVAWDRHGGKIALAAFGLAALLGWHPLGNGDWADAAVLLVGGLATVLGIDRLINRWYRRTQREPE